MPEKTPIQIIEYPALCAIEEEVNKRHKPSPDDADELWEEYHEALCEAAEKFGEAGDDPESEVDFYYSGDWSHELTDGFAIRTPRGISGDVLREFQSVVAAHHPDASLLLQGTMYSPIFGLHIYITATAIHVAWREQTPDACRKKLKKLGLDVE